MADSASWSSSVAVEKRGYEIMSGGRESWTQPDMILQQSPSTERLSPTSEEWKPRVSLNETPSSSKFFTLLILFSCVCYSIAVCHCMKQVYRNSLMYSCWSTLGALFGILALAQFEGLSLFIVRIMKKQSILTSLSLVVAIVACLIGGLINNAFLSLAASIFQCVCLCALSTTYNTSFLCFAWGHSGSQKAKE